MTESFLSYYADSNIRFQLGSNVSSISIYTVYKHAEKGLISAVYVVDD